MSDHLDLIRIRNLVDSTTEVFQGISGGVTNTVGSPITPKQEEYDLKNVWEAQKKLISTLITYLTKLEPGENGDAENIVNNYVSVLESSNKLSSSVTAYDISVKAASELLVIWETLNRQPPKELTKWVKSTESWGQALETWWKDGIGALYARDAAEDAIAAAQIALRLASTPEEAQAAQTQLANAQTDLSNAQGMMTTAAGELPGDSGSPMPGLVELITIARALMTGDFVLVGVVLIRIAVPLFIDFLVKWIGGKLPGRKTPPTQAELQKIADAVEDVALKDAIIRWGDNAAFHSKGQLLEY